MLVSNFVISWRRNQPAFVHASSTCQGQRCSFCFLHFKFLASFFDAKFPLLFRPARPYVGRILNFEKGNGNAWSLCNASWSAANIRPQQRRVFQLMFTKALCLLDKADDRHAQLPCHWHGCCCLRVAKKVSIRMHLPYVESFF